MPEKQNNTESPMHPPLKVRRPINSHIFHLAWTGLTFYQAMNSGLPARWIWGMLFVIAVAHIIRVIVKPHYMELRGTTLTVYLDFFSSITVDIGDIDRIEIKAGPWSKSRIVLKDNKRHVKFDYYLVRNADFDALVKAMGVPVE